MIFLIGRYWFTLALRVFFKRAYVQYEAPLPTDGPVIFACTHPNSAIDYLFAPLIHRMPTFVLVRGDVFEKKFLNAFFRAIYMLPVYRIRDGYSSLNKNEQSFKDCYHQFDKNGKVLIFSEGICVQEKTLQPIRKGTARLALEYLQKHGGKKIYIVPLATNYSRFRQFRGTVMVNYGTPIEVTQYTERYQENANKAFEALTADIQASLGRVFIQAKDYSDDSLTEQALMAFRLGSDERRRDWAIEDASVFKQEKRLVDVLNEKGASALSESWKKKAEELDLHPYREGLLHKRYGKGVYAMQMALLTPFLLLSALTLLLPYSFSKWVLRTKIKDIIFDNSVTIYGSFVVYILQMFVAVALGSIVLGWYAWLIIPAMVTLTMLGVELVDEFIFARYNYQWMPRKAEYQALYDEVAALIPNP